MESTISGIFVNVPKAQQLQITKLHSAYVLQFDSDGRSLQWLTMHDDKEVVLIAQPDTTFLFRLQNWLFGPFVPEQQL